MKERKINTYLSWEIENTSFQIRQLFTEPNSNNNKKRIEKMKSSI